MTASAEGIAAAAIDAFGRLPRKGKPSADEWSVLAAFVRCDAGSFDCECVALATGNRCIGSSARRATGDVLNDSHAEVLARRSLQRWLLNEATAALRGSERSSVFRVEESRRTLRLKPGVSLHMYVSQPPCGDAAIVAPSEEPSSKRRKREGEEEPLAASTMTTGAKRLLSGSVDGRVCAWEECAGPVLGACRVKPGRGDPTISMSCSDKIAMWQCTGLQGALLSRIIEEPLRLVSIVVSRPQGFDANNFEEALRRAFSTRISAFFPAVACTVVDNPPPPFKFRDPDDPSLRSSGTAINWSAPSDFEVTLSSVGKKLGTTAKSFSNPKQRSSLSKLSMFARFAAFCAEFGWQPHANISYRAAKDQASEYNQRKAKALECCFPNWIRKPPSEEQFHLVENTPSQAPQAPQ